jgi:hypothetical protein
MKHAAPPFQDLDYKAARRLIEAGYSSREQVLDAMNSGKLLSYGPGSPRQYGRILHDKVRAWLGLPRIDHLRIHAEGSHSRCIKAAPKGLDGDLCGKTAAFGCPVCRQVFAVSQNHHRFGRLCPRCQKSVAHIEGNGGKRRAWIEW